VQLASKSFVDPRSCLSVFNHYCLRPLRQPSTTLVHITVSADIARCHHYRQCNFGNKTCSEYFARETQDDVALRFKRRLQPAVESVLHELGISTWHTDHPPLWLSVACLDIYVVHNIASNHSSHEATRNLAMAEISLTYWRHIHLTCHGKVDAVVAALPSSTLAITRCWRHATSSLQHVHGLDNRIEHNWRNIAKSRQYWVGRRQVI